MYQTALGESPGVDLGRAIRKELDQIQKIR
jgi:hypothetical protein